MQGRKSKKFHIVPESERTRLSSDIEEVLTAQDRLMKEKLLQIVLTSQLDISRHQSKIFKMAHPSQIESVVLSLNIFLFFFISSQIDLSSLYNCLYSINPQFPRSAHSLCLYLTGQPPALFWPAFKCLPLLTPHPEISHPVFHISLELFDFSHLSHFFVL
jgi:hypothetical protein